MSDEAFAELVAAVELLRQRLAEQDAIIAEAVRQTAEDVTAPLVAALAMQERDLNPYTLN